MLDLKWISSEYKTKAKPAEIVRDYIAGMTDRYFERVFLKMTVPERVIGTYNICSSSSKNIISSASG
jgi:dGTPase